MKQQTNPMIAFGGVPLGPDSVNNGGKPRRDKRKILWFRDVTIKYFFKKIPLEIQQTPVSTHPLGFSFEMKPANVQSLEFSNEQKIAKEKDIVLSNQQTKRNRKRKYIFERTCTEPLGQHKVSVEKNRKVIDCMYMIEYIYIIFQHHALN